MRKHLCFSCSACKKAFTRKQNYELHQCVVKHTYTCDQCLKVYKSKLTFDKHKCSYCTKCKKLYSSFQKKNMHCCNESATEQADLVPDKSSRKRCTAPHPNSKTSMPAPEQVNLIPNKSSGKRLSAPHLNSKTSTPAPEQVNLIPNKSSGKRLSAPHLNSKTSTPAPEQVNLIPNKSSGKRLSAPHTSGNTGISTSLLSSECNDVQLISTSAPKQLEFVPVKSSWQRQQCLNLSIRGKTTLGSSKIRKPLTKPQHIQPIKGDGNCFFRSISFIVAGNEDRHEYFRHLLIHHMVQNEMCIKKVIPSNIAMAHYLNTSKMRQNGTWATEVEIFAMAHLLKTDIYIYTSVPTSNQFTWLNYCCNFVDKTIIANKERIYINHKNQNHYEVVLDVYRSADVVPQHFISEEKDSLLLHEIEHQINFSNDKPVFCCEQNKKCLSRSEREKLSIAEKRKDPLFKEEENRRKRESEKSRAKEKTIKHKKRQNKEECENENKRKRKSETSRNTEREIKKKKRQDKEERENENKRKRKSETSRNTEREIKKKKRQDKEERENENKRKRKSETSRNTEREIKKKKRQDKEERENENKRKRKSETSRNTEREIKKKKRQDKEERENENKRKRKSETSRNTEREIKKKKRQDKEERDNENIRKRNNCESRYKEKEHKQLKRSSSEYRESEKNNRKQKIRHTEEIISKFHQHVEKGPLYVCSCCHQLWYKETVIRACTLNVKNELKSKVSTHFVSVENTEWICLTCASYIKKNCVPPLSAYNINFPDKPHCLYLTNLEERLISPRIPFMMLHELPRGGQISINGNVVNVPSDVNSTVTNLPRNIDNNSTVALKLKRKLSYKHHVTFQNVRTNMVRTALQYLVNNSPLYREEGITIDKDWDLPPTNLEDRKEEQCLKDTETDDWDERDLESMPAGTTDTMLQPYDVLSDESSNVLCFAPAEGNHPISIFTDKYSEELAFPTIYCGQKREINVKISYNDICKSELRRKDRRAAGHIPNIFFKLKKIQAKHINERSSVALRKTKGNIVHTAGNLKSSEQLLHLIRHDEGYKILKDLRGSPPYWEKTKKDIFAMLRVLGIPTWFMSFSSAETRWVHLLKILSETVHGTKLTTEQVLNLTFFDKSELIQKDPVTCSRHFHHQVKKMISSILQTSYSPVGEVVDFFYKVEFQMRGSPHIHMLVWVKEAPKLQETEESEKSVIAFINAHATCQRDQSVEDLVHLQEHNHSRTCKKKGENICRFNFPLPPMPATCIVEPLDPSVTAEEKQICDKNWKIITKKLNDLRTEKTLIMTFKEFLDSLHLTEEEYMASVRSSIVRQQVFLKRDVHETRINSYNKVLLQCWRANIDIQYVLDPYACAIYIVTYIVKSQRGMSNLLYEAVKESKEGNSDLRLQVKKIGHKFLNHVEISAQEAVFYILQMPLKQASREVVFVNTSPSDQRVVMLKSFTTMKNLDDDSTDISTTSMLQRYAERPHSLEMICLADFVSHYKIVYRSTKHSGDTESSSDEEETTAESKCYKMSDGNLLKKRQHPAVIRYVRYQQSVDQENYFREILMLFHPWRTESSIIRESETFTQRYITVSKITDIENKMSEYNHQFAELDKALEDMNSLKPELIAQGWNNVDPHQHAAEEEDIAMGPAESDQYLPLVPQSDNIRQFSEFNQDVTLRCEQQKNYLLDSHYTSLARQLNNSQRHFFLHMLHHFKTSEKPVYVFLSGGAGVGKTLVVTVLYQALMRFFNSKPETNPDNPKVLLAAPTGKAAYLIKGNTLHSLLHIPANQGFGYSALKSDTLNTFRQKFVDVKLLIIDEISMVGNAMFNFVNKRLQQIMGTTRLFGGISVLAVGDLFQLKPVFDGWIFQLLKDDYGPLAVNLWSDNFRMFELEEVMRQKESKQFAEILNRLRQGNHTKKDISILKSRERSTDMLHPDYPIQTPHIYIRNPDVDNHNSVVCELQGSCKFVSKAFDVVLGDVTENVKAEILTRIPKDTSKTMGLATEVKTVVGIRNEISCNIDIEDGLANGASFVFLKEGILDKDGKPKFIWAKFDDERIGLQCREKNKSLYINEICKEWTPIFRIKRQFPIGRYKNILVLRSQFPIRCAVAKSCHRCQGDTMESAIADFSGKCFAHSHYVALSRVTKIDNLQIRSLNENKIHVDKKVVAEMQRLRSFALLNTQPNLIADSSFVVLYHNVRSQQKHFNDILTSPIYQETDINIFSETKLSKKIDSCNLQLPNYTFRRYDSCNKTYGLTLYIKDNVEVTQEVNENQCYGKEYMELVIVQVATRLPNIPVLSVGAVYISPKTSPIHLRLFLQKIYKEMSARNKPFMLLGDFNVDVMDKSNTYLTEILHCTQVISEITTDGKSLLDHIYVSDSIRSYQCHVVESYFSDHKAVIIALK